MSCDEDDVMLFCDRRRTVSSNASFNPDYHDISRDFAKAQYPELYKIHRQNPSGEIEVPDKVLSTDYRDIAGSRELLFREALSLFDKARKLEKHNRELKKQNKDSEEASLKWHAMDEEEYINNLLLKRIEQIKNDKEAIVRRYEKDEEMATKELQHKVRQLENARLEERCQLRERSVIDSEGRQIEEFSERKRRRIGGHNVNSPIDDEVMNFFLRDKFLMNRAKEYGVNIDANTRESVSLTIHGIVDALENQIQSFLSKEAAYQKEVKHVKGRMSALEDKVSGYDLSTNDFISRMSSLIEEFVAETKEIRSPSNKEKEIQRLQTYYEFVPTDADDPDSLNSLSPLTSEAGEMSCDEDDVMLFCDRRRTVSSNASFNPDYHDISRDFAKAQYPELYKIHRQNPSGEIEVPDKVLSTDYRDIAGSRELLFREALSLFDKARKLEKHNRELKKQNKDSEEASLKWHAMDEEEYINNLLLKRIEQIKNDKEAIVRRYEKDEEMATKELQHKVRQLENARLEERCQLRERSVIDSEGRQIEEFSERKRRRIGGHNVNSPIDDEVMNFFLRDKFLMNRAKEYGVNIDANTRESVSLTIHGIVDALENQIQSFLSKEAAYQKEVKHVKGRMSALEDKVSGYDLSTNDFISRMSSLIEEFVAETKEIRSPSNKEKEIQRLQTYYEFVPTDADE